MFVDTSVWSLAFRRDRPPDRPEVAALHDALTSGAVVVSTWFVLQEILQGVQGPKQRNVLIERFRSLPMITPSRDDHIEAASLHSKCRRAGVQLGTVDALLAALCLGRDLTLLTTDHDFGHAAVVVPSLRLWNGLG